jgi:hypothetical protein
MMIVGNCSDCPLSERKRGANGSYTELFCRHEKAKEQAEDTYCGILEYLYGRTFFPLFCPIPQDYSVLHSVAGELKRRVKK